ncbi:MAG TPA: XTP/dITP diphosphatase [bacterium]|nr:XTP/dITP diphosphatase [bacterium]
MLEIVVATGNQGKLDEIAHALAGLPVKLLSLAEFPGAPEVVEDGETFLENAVKKARATAAHAKKHALADDSGLAVDALGGAPGVFSARFAGVGASDDMNNNKLLAALARTPAPRTAQFVCVLCLASPAGDIITAEGRCPGEILDAPRGHHGFGYDPLFCYPPLGATFAEITREQKLQVSHRGRALAALREKIMAIV